MNPMPRVMAVQGHRVRYLAAGSGPAVVLLHGLGESPADWTAVLPQLSPSRAVYAPALPGHDGEGDPADASPEGRLPAAVRRGADPAGDAAAAVTRPLTGPAPG
jgi:pimeloyl-ACP methyl ester carboxylesterase